MQNARPDLNTHTPEHPVRIPPRNVPSPLATVRVSHQDDFGLRGQAPLVPLLPTGKDVAQRVDRTPRVSCTRTVPVQALKVCMSERRCRRRQTCEAYPFCPPGGSYDPTVRLARQRLNPEPMTVAEYVHPSAICDCTPFSQVVRSIKSKAVGRLTQCQDGR